MTIQLEQEQEVVLVNEEAFCWTDDIQVINAHFCLFPTSYIYVCIKCTVYSGDQNQNVLIEINAIMHICNLSKRPIYCMGSAKAAHACMITFPAQTIQMLDCKRF